MAPQTDLVSAMYQVWAAILQVCRPGKGYAGKGPKLGSRCLLGMAWWVQLGPNKKKTGPEFISAEPLDMKLASFLHTYKLLDR